jgi:hypothetical protein
MDAKYNRRLDQEESWMQSITNAKCESYYVSLGYVSLVSLCTIMERTLFGKIGPNRMKLYFNGYSFVLLFYALDIFHAMIEEIHQLV